MDAVLVTVRVDRSYQQLENGATPPNPSEALYVVWDPNLWTIPLLLAGVLTAALAWTSWKFSTFPGLEALSRFLFFITIWILAYLGEIMATGAGTMVWLARIEYIGIVLIGPLWLAFALAYTGRSSMVTRRRTVGMLIIPVITLLLAWTTSWHGLVWQSFEVIDTSAGTVLAPSYGPWFWVNMAFQYGCLALATFLLLWGIAKDSSPVKGRGMALAAGTLAPWAGNMLYVAGWEEAAGIDLTVYGAAVAGVAFGWGILARGLIEIVPVAREKVVEISKEAVLVIDRTGRIVDANPSARGLLEGPIPLPRSKAAEALAHHGLDPDALDLGHCLLELDVGDPPRSRIFDCQVSELGQGGATSPGRVMALRDVTEAELHRRALEEGREALEAQLRQSQKLEMVGTMAGGIAHDFNNILAAMRGYAELALFETPDDSPAKEDLIQILQGADRARHLVRQILTFSRQAPEDRQNIRLEEVFEETVGFLRASLPATVELKATLNPEVPGVYADGTQMQQVLLNLCSNAADAMTEMQDGVLEVSMGPAVPEPGRLPDHLGAEPGQEWVRLRVKDKGSGMDEATRQKVFEPFFTTKEVGKGTGLGMSVVHGIVVSHGGWVEVASHLGEGTEVTIWLPGAHGDEGVREQEGPDSAMNVDLPAKQVLVVDDEEPLLDLTRRLLEGMGHEVRNARTVKEANDFLKSNHGWPDLVLTDHTMPGGTGLELVESIRAAGMETPIIMMTGFGDAIPLQDLEASGVDVLLAKPFSRTELVSALTSLLRES